MLRTVLVACALALASCQTARGEPVSFDLVNRNGVEGERYRSSDFLGFPIVVELYFNGCSSCEANARNVRELAEVWHGDRAQVVELGIDCGSADYLDWIARHAPFGPVLDDCDRIVAHELGVRSYPTTIVLGRDHEVIYRSIGVWSSSIKRDINNALESAYNGSAPQ